jgi:hypothetical protein
VHDPFEPYVGQMCEGITHSIYGTYTPLSLACAVILTCLFKRVYAQYRRLLRWTTR